MRVETKEELRLRLIKDTEEFLENGGEIEELPYIEPNYLDEIIDYLELV